MYAAPMIAPDAVIQQAQNLVAMHARPASPWQPALWRTAAAAAVLFAGAIGYGIGGDTLREQRFVDQRLATELSFGSFDFDMAPSLTEVVR